MNKYSQKFIVGWSIAFSLLLIFNVLVFLSPMFSDALWNWLSSLDVLGILLILLLWPILLANMGMAAYGMIIAIIVDIVVLLIFYSAQKKTKSYWSI